MNEQNWQPKRIQYLATVASVWLKRAITKNLGSSADIDKALEAIEMIKTEIQLPNPPKPVDSR